MKSFEKQRRVPVPEYLLFHISYSPGFFQYAGLDVSGYPKMEPGYTGLYCFFMVYHGHLVWLGLLFLYRLALDGTKEARLS